MNFKKPRNIAKMMYCSMFLAIVLFSMLRTAPYESKKLLVVFCTIWHFLNMTFYFLLSKKMRYLKQGDLPLSYFFWTLIISENILYGAFILIDPKPPVDLPANFTPAELLYALPHHPLAIHIMTIIIFVMLGAVTFCNKKPRRKDQA
ncbi:MAG: hypothetical protein AB8B77_08580 [Alphaproteobacteria bacterium]